MEESLQQHIANAYNIAVEAAKGKLIIPLNMPVSQFLFKNFACLYEDNKIEIGYHGTRNEVVKSIETFGMLDPTSIKYKVANGNVYGKGVYVSPVFEYSNHYAQRGGCLLIVLYIRGKVQDTNPRINIDLEGDFAFPVPEIVVLRSTTQVLPVFAIDYKKDHPVVLERDKNYDEIKDFMNSATYNDNLLEIATRIRDENDTNVKVPVVYNLLLQAMDGSDVCSSEIQSKIADKISQFDYSEY